MSDPVKRPLQVPAWHIPYLEKHKIYELFHEIARELVIQKPADHVLFIKQILQNAAKSRDVPRILILDTPHVNCLEIAKEIAKRTGQIVISNENLLQYLGQQVDDVPSEVLVRALVSLVRAHHCYSKGWIMVNCIRDETDAKLLVKAGIIPTHTVLIIAPFHPDLTNLLYCNVKTRWPSYRRRILALKDVFKTSLKEVHLGKMQLINVVEEIVQLSKNRNISLHNIKRVLLLGPRGSGRKTQAKLLSETLNLVHVDFEYLLCSYWISPTELGQQLRQCRNEVCFHSELLTQVINERILKDDCLKNGWVLTGFPFTVTDFKYLDSLDTPPNTVIFLECDINICKERLVHRRMNIHSGSITNIKENPDVNNEFMKIHPKDQEDMVKAEQQFYCENYGIIRNYCGSTASFVNADQGERHVHEYITAVLLRGAPAGSPRAGLGDLDSSSSSNDQSCCNSIPQQVVDCFIKKL